VKNKIEEVILSTYHSVSPSYGHNDPDVKFNCDESDALRLILKENEGYKYVNHLKTTRQNLKNPILTDYILVCILEEI
jgi:hypothetical protein